MATELTMPKMGFDMTEGKLAQWLKAVGDPVKKGEPVAEIETDKVNIEVEAPADGVLRGTFLEAGQTVPVGTLIGVLGKADEAIDLDALRAKAGGVAAPAAAPQPEEAAASLTTPAATATDTNGRIKASPLARRMASEAGLSLAEVTGSGPGGRITKRDVDAAIAAGRAQPAAEPPVATPHVAAPASLEPAMLQSESVPLTRLRQTIARRLTTSKAPIPHFYVTSEIDMAEATALRMQLNLLIDPAARISMNDMVVKAAALALTHFPNINASFAETAIQRHGAVHMGIAVALNEGLITIVVRDADRKSLAQIARESKDIVARARSGKARPEELQGSTFTVSNLGMYDVESFTAIINPPEAAILAVGSVIDAPVVKDGQVAPGKRMKATISADHRVTDGAEAARFMQLLKKNLEEPLRLLI